MQISVLDMLLHNQGANQYPGDCKTWKPQLSCIMNNDHVLTFQYTYEDRPWHHNAWDCVLCYQPINRLAYNLCVNRLWRTIRFVDITWMDTSYIAMTIMALIDDGNNNR